MATPTQNRQNITRRTGSAAPKATPKAAPKAAPQPDAAVAGAETEAQRPFVKLNFILMGISLLLIVTGFLLMLGSSNDSATQFNYDIFSTRRIVVAPTVAFIGFVAMAFAIVYSPKEKKSAELAMPKEQPALKEVSAEKAG